MAKQHPHQHALQVLNQIEKELIACQTRSLDGNRIIEYLILVGRFSGCVETLMAESRHTTGDVFAKVGSIQALLDEPRSIYSLLMRNISIEESKKGGIGQAILNASTVSLLSIVASNLQQMREQVLASASR